MPQTPIGLDWESTVEHFRNDCGGWTALADEFVHRTRDVVDAPTDRLTVEKGLRRLSAREHKPGGQYGRWLLRFFGVPDDVETWARQLVQYHSRFADLPTSIRRDQLRLWDRPPASESRLAPWIHAGMASIHHRQRDLVACHKRLTQARAGMERAGPAAILEIRLFEARLHTDEGRRDRAASTYVELSALLEEADLSREERLAYHARLTGQRAYHLTRPLKGEAEDLEGAIALFESIPEEPDLPFVCFRRLGGLAWCRGRQGRREEGAQLARRAMMYAGDGGLVRFRVMALNLLIRLVDKEEAELLRARAKRMARLLEDEDLDRRVN